MKRAAVAFVGLFMLTPMWVACAGRDAASLPHANVTSRHAANGSHAGDLLYAAMGHAIYMLTYPQGKQVGHFQTDQFWPKVCPDSSNGRVYIDGNAKMYEYDHGALKPMLTLSAPPKYNSLDGCSVDPATGNLAVVNYWAPALLVYPKGALTPQIYVNADPAVKAFYYCGYDDSGNIFIVGYRVDGSYVDPAFVELPKGANAFVTITIPFWEYPQKVQWDGTYLAVTFAGRIYRAQVSGTKARIVSITGLKGDNVFAGGISWIEGGSAIAPYGDDFTRKAGLWAYPAGGDATTVLHRVSDHDVFSDLAVSRAPR